jgi:hypothetical protein
MVIVVIEFCIDSCSEHARSRQDDKRKRGALCRYRNNVIPNSTPIQLERGIYSYLNVRPAMRCKLNKFKSSIDHAAARKGKEAKSTVTALYGAGPLDAPALRSLEFVIEYGLIKYILKFSWTCCQCELTGSFHLLVCREEMWQHGRSKPKNGP